MSAVAQMLNLPAKQGLASLIAVLIVTMGSKATSGQTSTEVSEHTLQLARANNAFAIHLYQTLQAQNDGKNLFFSPLSISTALAMTHLGARDITASQISEVFRFNQLEENRLHQSFKELNSLLYQPVSKYILKAANKLYGKAGFDFSQNFLDGTGTYYNSAFESINDFAAPEARQKINDWILKQTEGKIADLIAPGVLDSLTRLVLVNAIYFKGNWEKKFKPDLTSPDIFKVPNEIVKVKMMKQKGKFLLGDDKTRKCFILELPYVGSELSMVLVVPWEDDGLVSVEASLSEEALEFWESDLEEETVNVELPRFKLEEMFSLKTVLASMGMTDAFDQSKANFEGMTGDRSLHVSAVLHKAFVEVNEEGSEAAAATGVVMQKRSIGPRPYDVKADHPFLFMIRDRRTKAILFMGRMVDPPHESRVGHDEL